MDATELELPFFAYGVFQPAEISYPRIKSFVVRSEPAFVAAKMIERDGIRLLVLNEDGQVKGHLLWFGEDRTADAYRAIDALEPRRQYLWAKCSASAQSGTHEARVLVARKPSRGHPTESTFRSRDDPLFREALDEIDSLFWPRPPRIGQPEVAEFFRYQMAYMLLWSSIERFCTLRWGFTEQVTARIAPLASEPAFVEALARVGAEPRRVYRADDPSVFESLDPQNPAKSLKFYYQVRSNIVHRGKTAWEETDLVRSSLKELTTIFRQVLDSTLGAPS